MSTDDLKERMITALKNDKKDILYTYLNNGEIRLAFGDKINFINYLKTSNYLEYEIVGEFRWTKIIMKFLVSRKTQVPMR